MNELTTENMAVYVGGQVEILGTGVNEYRHRGQISKIAVISEERRNPLGAGQDAMLHVEFEYICELEAGVGYKPSENKPYDLSLLICAVSDIGIGRLCINSNILGEMAIFYPPTHNKRILASGDFERDDD